MRFIIKLFLFFFCFCVCACRKVIDIKIKDSDSKYVIEGIITNEPGVCRVSISHTNAFNQNNIFPAVHGAVVKIKDNGIETTLTETADGLYQTNTINGTPGHVYQLAVNINNQVFTASCTMPQPVTLDTLYISPGPFGQFKFATVSFMDPAGINNGYRFVQYVNGVKDPRIFWEDDELTDGEKVLLQLDTGVDKKDDPRNINSGDAVTIEMLSLDEAVYKYWYGLRSGGGDGTGNIASPYNPVTNITGGALGYFSAHTVSRRTAIAP
jgi:hypothetical protein